MGAIVLAADQTIEAVKAESHDAYCSLLGRVVLCTIMPVEAVYFYLGTYEVTTAAGTQALVFGVRLVRWMCH